MTEMTKKVLSQSLKKLLSTKSLNKITVKDIVKDCQLTRQTFYYHFQDIYELLDWTYKCEIGELIYTSENIDWEKTIRKFLNYIQENKSVFSYTIQAIGREHFERIIYPDLYKFSKKTIKNIAGEMSIPNDKINFLANMHAISLISISMQWANKGMKENPDEIVRMLYTTIYTATLNVLKEYEATI